MLLSEWGPVATGLAAALAALVVVTQPGRTRRHSEGKAAEATIDICFEAMSITTDRLALRFSPALQASEGQELRQLRATAAIAAVNELKASELPIKLVGLFVRVRSGLNALNEAMNTEPTDKDINLGVYKTLYEWTRGDYEALRTLVRTKTRHDPGTKHWMPPAQFAPLNWKRRRVEADRAWKAHLRSAGKADSEA